MRRQNDCEKNRRVKSVHGRIAQIRVNDRTRKDLGDVETLPSSICDLGLLHPIILNGHRELVAGQRLLAARRQLGWRCVPCIVNATFDELSALLAVERDEIVCRKTLTPEAAVIHGERLRVDVDNLAKAAQQEGRKHGGGERRSVQAKHRSRKSFPQAIRDESKRTDAHIAAAVGMSQPTYQKVNEVGQSVNRLPEEYGRLLAQLNRTRRVNGIHWPLRIDERVEKIKTQPGPLRRNRFRILVVELPWEFSDEADDNVFGRTRPPYPTIPFKDLPKWGVGGLVDVNSHLNLWITIRSLPKGFALMESWDFRYIPCLTRDTVNIGIGNYFRNLTEHVLFGVGGSQRFKRRNIGTLFQTKRGPDGHSNKRDEFCAVAEDWSPEPYLEMFTRLRCHGWTCRGSEVIDHEEAPAK